MKKHPQGMPHRHPRLFRFLPMALLFLACLSGTSPLFAADQTEQGWYIEAINRNADLDGSGQSEEQTKTYIAFGKMKVVNSGPEATNMILDPKSGNMVFLNDASKEYFRINVQQVMDAMKDPRMAQMRKMLGETRITVTDTGETKKIGEWKCRKYTVTKTGMMSVTQEIWATRDVDLDISDFNSMISMSNASEAPEDAAQKAELEKIKGYPILTTSVMDMMGSKLRTEQEVTIIRKEKIAASIFEIPAGYTEKDMQSMQGPVMAPHGDSAAPATPAPAAR